MTSFQTERFQGMPLLKVEIRRSKTNLLRAFKILKTAALDRHQPILTADLKTWLVRTSLWSRLPAIQRSSTAACPAVVTFRGNLEDIEASRFCTAPGTRLTSQPFAQANNRIYFICSALCHSIDNSRFGARSINPIQSFSGFQVHRIPMQKPNRLLHCKHVLMSCLLIRYLIILI